MKPSPIPISLVCRIGAGSVGGSTMAMIADRCNQVQFTVVDLNANRIAAWNDQNLGQLPMYEPWLVAVVSRERGCNLHFSTSVNTRNKAMRAVARQASDLHRIEASAHQVAACTHGHTILAYKSTLSVRSAEVVQAMIGAFSSQAGSKGAGFTILVLSKLTVNILLAQCVISIKSITAFCESTCADVGDFGRAISTASRIDPKFLHAGPGFFCICYQKAILNLVYLRRHYGLEEVAANWEQMAALKTRQQQRIKRLLIAKLVRTFSDKPIAVLGDGFLADTNESRKSAANMIFKDFFEQDSNLLIVDSNVSEPQIGVDLGQSQDSVGSVGIVSWYKVPYFLQAASSADALLKLTDSYQFTQIDRPMVAAVKSQSASVLDPPATFVGTAALAAGTNTWLICSQETDSGSIFESNVDIHPRRHLDPPCARPFRCKSDHSIFETPNRPQANRLLSPIIDPSPHNKNTK